VFGTYQRLSPADAWDPSRGFGWVGNPPADRDRGLVDDLQRDFVLSRTPATLRVSVSPGRHDLYLLAGDAAFSSGDTVVSEDGQVLAEMGQTLARGEFRYLPVRPRRRRRRPHRRPHDLGPVQQLLASGVAGDAGALLAPWSETASSPFDGPRRLRKLEIAIGTRLR
jgi:hypothetical protein